MPEDLPPSRRRVSVLSWVAVAAFVPVTVLTATTVASWIGSGVGGAGMPGRSVVSGTTAFSGQLPQGDWGTPTTGPAAGSASLGPAASSLPVSADPSAARSSTGAPLATSRPAGAPPSSAGPSSSRRGAHPEPTEEDESAEAEVLALVNDEREAAGCEPLTVDPRLAEAAAQHATDMVARHYFSHTAPNGTGPATRAAHAGYDAAVGENIAVGYSGATAVMDGWTDSADHHANMVNCAYKVTGIGYDPGAVGPQWGAGAWVELFGMT